MQPVPRTWRYLLPAATVFALAVAPETASTQTAMRRDTTLIGRLIYLGRSRRDAEAVGLQRKYLAANLGAPTTPQHCAVLSLNAGSEARLQENTRAQKSLADFDQLCGTQTLEPGYRRDIEIVRRMLRGEAAASAPARRDEPARANPLSANPLSTPQPTTPARIGPVAAARDESAPVGDPAAMGLDVQALARHRALCERTGADACLVAYKGQLVQEWYGPRYRRPMYAMSSTKSVTGLLVGMLIDDGRIKSIDARVCEYLSEWCAGPRGRVTLRHLLTMTSGLPNMQDARSVGFAADKNSHVRALTPATEPGSAWAYSNEGVQLLSPILDKAAGEPIQDYARKRLFEPLGMSNSRLNIDAAGHAWTYADMLTTPREFARIGMLMAQRGMWAGKRIVSEAWIDASVQPSQKHNAEYGLLWWTAMPAERRFASLGYLNTDMQVMPDQQLVVVRMQSKPTGTMSEAGYHHEAYNLFEDFVRPASRSPGRD